MGQLFDEVGRLPLDGDNVAIAIQDLAKGMLIDMRSETLSMSHSVLEGHRFAVRHVPAGEPLFSWGMEFGRATRDIEPGEYVCNSEVLHTLRSRRPDLDLPGAANFSDEITPFLFDTASFTPTPPLERTLVADHFKGYDRGPDRGVGTRNYIVLLGVSSRVSGFIRRLEERCKELVLPSGLDGIVGVHHTEGDDVQLNNSDMLLRTLSGFIVHPNVGAVLIVDQGQEPVTNVVLRSYFALNKYPLDSVVHAFLSVGDTFQQSMDKGLKQVCSWIPHVAKQSRTMRGVDALSVALQCGGSDAFSGISGNPLAGWIARRIVAQGGQANLAETDELLGAEAYVLKRVRDERTARRFLGMMDRFVQRAERHGSSAAGNPSGGNKYRGLYNIYLKSLGAAMKKHPDVRLDHVIEYAERMTDGGFYFMDSPGNDLESIAGQVASGCNLIYFVTGNGSITNFPFVPTVKIVTTTPRYRLLENDMDINAGSYLDGMSMEDLGKNALRFSVEVASGKQTAGELAGHAQVQIWRNWRQSDAQQGPPAFNTDANAWPGSPIPLKATTEPGVSVLCEFLGDVVQKSNRIALIVPTSLCSGQVARMAAEQLNEKATGLVKSRAKGFSRFATLIHTEGCGASSGRSEGLFVRTMVAHLRHPFVASALLLEHGCEKTHNDYFQAYLAEQGIDIDAYGWASIQREGGIQNVLQHIERWFEEADSEESGWPRNKAMFSVGIVVDGSVTKAVAESLAPTLIAFVRSVVEAGHSVFIPVSHQREECMLDLLCEVLLDGPLQPTLSVGQIPAESGFHMVDVPSGNWQEIITAMGAAHVHCLLQVGSDVSLPGHPFIPMLHVSKRDHTEVDLALDGNIHGSDIHVDIQALVNKIEQTLDGRYVPVKTRLRNYDFQISRGMYGISL